MTANAIRLMAAALATASAFAAAAYPAGTEVKLTQYLIGRVLTESGSDHTIEVYANPDSKPYGALNIPSQYVYSTNTYVITRIANHGFEGCELTAVTVNAPLTHVGDYAFKGCTKLSGFTETEPGTITSVGESAFEFTSSLKSIELTGLETIGNFAFMQSGLTSISLPTVKTIGAGAFRQCPALTTVVLGEGVLKVGNMAFSDYPSLAAITLPPGLKELGARAISGNPKLEEIVVPNGLNKAGAGALADNGLRRVFIIPYNFMNYCDQSGLLTNLSVTEVYAHEQIVGKVADYLTKGSADTPAESLAPAIVSPLDDVLRVDKIEAGHTTFRLEPCIKGISDIHVYTFKGGQELLPNADGIFSFAGTKALFEYRVNTYNLLSYYDLDLSGIGEAVVDGIDSPAALYDLQGRPAPAMPSPGLYLRRQGDVTEKILIK